MKVLLFSSLFPSSVRPIHGIFVETRLRELLKTGEVEAKVVAPVPWFPLKGSRWGEYAQFAATPRFEHRNGLDVHHPRYLLLPKVGMNMAPASIARAAWPAVDDDDRRRAFTDTAIDPRPDLAAFDRDAVFGGGDRPVCGGVGGKGSGLRQNRNWQRQDRQRCKNSGLHEKISSALAGVISLRSRTRHRLCRKAKAAQAARPLSASSVQMSPSPGRR